MKINSDEIILKNYILLDWNVIKYLKKPRNCSDKELYLLIEQIRRKYEFPFCEAHLRDLSRSYSETNKKLVEDDLNFLQQLSQSIAIGIDDSNHFCLVKHNPTTLFQDIIRENTPKPNITPEMNPQSIFKVDMQALDQDHPLRATLEKTDGVCGPGIMANWMNSLFDPLFNEIDDYKKFRDYAKRIKRDLKNNKLQRTLSHNDNIYLNWLTQHMIPFIDCLEIENEDALANVWKDVITKWLQLSYFKDIPFGQLITTAYVMLDYHPLFREKLKKKKNTLSNITRDSKMVYYASSGKYFVTEDGSCREKATFLFKAFKINTDVVSIEQFNQKFS